MGDRLASLREARQRVFAIPSAGAPFLSSALYETEPVGCAVDVSPFLNAVIEIGHEGDAHELLRDLRQVEESLGRPAEHARNAPRTIDLDLLYFGDHVIRSAELQLPHPRVGERRFVLQPLVDIRPELTLPNCGQSVADLLAELPASPGVVRIASQW
jgi:2-amino-4-hydroxy-6-hydroxymethyldihydropteridine diphosphokinase